MTPPGPDPLMIGLSAGDERAYSLLYEQFAARLVRTAAAILGSREDAEDAVQDVFVALVRSRRQLGEIEDMTAYLFAALRHAAARCAARRERAVPGHDFVGEMPARAESCSDHAIDGELQEHLQRALQELPPEQREVVSLRLAGELTFAQIARASDVSTQTVASRYRYALEKLRILLKEHG
jgi:RNA polymerase sigma-70 factor (ECF subfamily)